MERNYDEMMMDEIFVDFVKDTIKASFTTVKDIKFDDIKGFKAAGESLVMMVNESKDVCFEVMKSGFDVYEFYSLLDAITGDEHPKTVYNIIDGYVNAGNHALMFYNISKIIKEAKADVTSHEVYSMMLDGFKGKNLVNMAEQEHNLKKYVLMALERMCA